VAEQCSVGGGLGPPGVLGPVLVHLQFLELPRRLGVGVGGVEGIGPVVHDVAHVLLRAEEGEVFLVGRGGLQIGLSVVRLLGQCLELGGQIAGQLFQLHQLLAAGDVVLEGVDLDVHRRPDQELDVLLLGGEVALGRLERVIELLRPFQIQVGVGLDLHQLAQGGDGPFVLLLDEVAVAQLVQRQGVGGAALGQFLEVLQGSLGGPGLGVAVDQVQQRLPLDVERLLGVDPRDRVAPGRPLEEGDRLVELLLVDPDPAQLVAGQVVHRALGELKDGLVVLLGLGQIGLVEVVVADDLLGFQPQRALGVLGDQLVERLEHLVELAQLPHFVGQVEGDLVGVVEVGELAEETVVELDRLLLEELGFGADDGALGLASPLGVLEEVDVAALLHVELGQAELEVRQIGSVAALGDEPLGFDERAVDLEDVPLQLLHVLGLLPRPGDDRIHVLVERGEQRRVRRPGRQGEEKDADGHWAPSSRQRLGIFTR
jgi:hypothetical protein